MKNTFGFYVLERILVQCQDQQVISSIKNEIKKGLTQLIGCIDPNAHLDTSNQTNSTIQLRQKWIELLDKINSNSVNGTPQIKRNNPVIYY